jgi:membrane fusion protein (multidrug efflux system)
MSSEGDKPSSIAAPSTATEDASAAPATDPAPVPQQAPKAPRKRKLVLGVLGIVVLVAVLVFGVPAVREMLTTVSTDDAYVNGHVTFVAPRVPGQIARVLVDDNNRVHKGELLAELDKEPFQVAVSQKQAAVDTAKADLQAAVAAARAVEAQAMSERWALQNAVEGVDSQVALLHARVADINKSKAALTLAQLQFDRARNSSSPWRKSTRSASRWGCRPSLTRASVSTRYRPISTRPFHLSSRRRRH